jgi:phage tail sheath gpL-like
MTISFNQIPVNLRVPGVYIEFDSSRALQGLPGQPHRLLVIGQRLSTGAVAAEVPTLITGVEQAEAAWGRGSMIAAMFRALKTANRRTESWGIALDDDGAGVQAASTLVLTGPATAAGTLSLYIAGVRVRTAVADADTATEVAAALVAAVNADDTLPVTAAVNGVDDFKVDLTARHKGVAGNHIDLRINYRQGEALPAGIGITTPAMAAGTANPDVADAIAAFGDTQYHTIAMPYTDADNLAALAVELEARWGPLVMKEGHAFAAERGTVGDLVTFGGGLNSPFLTVMGQGAAPQAPWVWAAAVAGIDAAEPDPARPRQTLLLPGLLPPAEADAFTPEERELLLNNGVATYTVAPGGTVHVERLITTYQLNALAIPDTSYLDVTTVRTLAYLRFSTRVRFGLKFPRHKLADDGTQFAPGQAIATPGGLRLEYLALFRDWEFAGLVEGFEQFKDDLIVERDAGDPNRVNAQLPPDLINQLRVQATQIQFRL